MIEGIELDHVFVSASGKQQDADLLAAHGLMQGASRIHNGQGTANACFFFDNAYLELIWLHDETEIRSAAVEPLALWERMEWRRTGACPFGVAFRISDPESDQPQVSWRYEAPFLPAGQNLPFVTPQRAPQEPLVFVSAGSPGPPSSYPSEKAVPLEHAGKRRMLRRIRLESPAASISNGVRAMAGRLLSLEPGDQHHMRLEFESGSEEVDFRPALPLSLVW